MSETTGAAARSEGLFSLGSYGMPPLIYRFVRPKPGNGGPAPRDQVASVGVAGAAEPQAGDLELIDITSNVPSEPPIMAPSDEVTQDLAGLTFQPAPQAVEQTHKAPSTEPSEEGELITLKLDNTHLWNRLHDVGDYDSAEDSSIGSSHPSPSSHGPWSTKSSSHGLPRIPVLQPTKSAASSPRFVQTFTNSSASVRITPSPTSAGVTIPRIYEHKSVHALSTPPARPSSSRKDEPAWLQTNATAFLAAQRENEERQKRERAAAAGPLLIDYSDDKGKGKETEVTAPAGQAQPTMSPAPTAGFPSGPSQEPEIGRGQESSTEETQKEGYSFW
ncbi:MAG: hypothetical protein Q9188_007172 [Gyalolechia gomerana]